MATSPWMAAVGHWVSGINWDYFGRQSDSRHSWSCLCPPLSQQLKEHSEISLQWNLKKISQQLSWKIKSHLIELQIPGGAEEFSSVTGGGKGSSAPQAQVSISHGCFFPFSCCLKNQISTIPLCEHQRFLLLGGAVKGKETPGSGGAESCREWFVFKEWGAGGGREIKK